jgi:hypothetical protein
MSTLDELTAEFDRLLATIPRGDNSLDDWRYAYRKIVYSGAKRILSDFPDLITGPRPLPRQFEQGPGSHPGGGGAAFGGGVVHPVAEGQPPPYRPSAVNQLLCLVLGTCPQQT